MAEAFLKGNTEIKSACITPQDVYPGVLSRNGMQAGSRFMHDPATGTLVVRPEFDLEIQTAILGAARRNALRQHLRLFGLYLQQFTLSLRAARLKLARYVYSYLLNFAFDRHDQSTLHLGSAL